MQIFVESLGWTLLHFIWQGAAIGLLFAVLMRLLARASAELRYVVGLGCLLVVACAPVATFLAIAGGSAAEPAPAMVTATALGSSATAAHHVDVGAWAQFARGFDALLPWAVLGWLIGVSLNSLRLIRDWLNVRMLVRRGVRPLPADWQRRVMRLKETLGVVDKVIVLESMLVKVPMLIGWLRPVVLIPSSALLGLTPRQLELIIAHELAHIRRYDYLVNLCQVALETLFFYHPAVRWMSSRIRAERENCCDDTVVACCGDTLTYARALTEMESLRFMPTQMAIAVSGGQLIGRINRLVDLDRPQRGSAHWLVGALLGGVALALLAGTHVVLDDVHEEAAAKPAKRARPAALESIDSAVAPEPLVAATPELPAAPDLPAAGGVAEASPASSPAAEPAIAASDAGATGTVLPRRAPAAAVPVEAPSMIALPDEPDAAGRAGELPGAPVDAAALVAETVEPPAAEPQPAFDLQEVRVARARLEVPDVAPAPQVVEPAVVAEQQTGPQMTGGALIAGQQPAYPVRARYRGIEGYVTVSFTVTRTGQVRDIHVVDSRRSSQFNRAVTDAIKTWRFEPFRVEGVPIERVLTHTVEFKLDASGPSTVGGESCEKMTGSRICRMLPDGTADPVRVVQGQ